jgi:hypothetical protein
MLHSLFPDPGSSGHSALADGYRGLQSSAEKHTMAHQHTTHGEIYSIPRRFRATENLHVVLWLLKDMCWAMDFRVGGVLMFIPTLSAAILITWQTRKIRSDLFHNIAMLCWITANGYWMMSEFFFPQYPDLRYYAAIPFGIGLSFVGYFYGGKALRYQRGRMERFEEASEMVPAVPQA